MGCFHKDKAHGQGVLVDLIGKELRGGAWVDGRHTGPGFKLLLLGERYTGDILDGKCTGQGTVLGADGREVRGGTWKDDKQEGDGYVRFHQDGSVYIGKMSNDLPHGKGILYDSTGSIELRVGQWVAGKLRSDTAINKWVYRAGEGELHGAPPGSRYEGGMVDDQRHGIGTMYTPDGRLWYGGEFKDDLLDGEGWCMFANGHKYVGRFEAHKCVGAGSELEPDSRVHHKVLFKDGKQARVHLILQQGLVA